MRASNRTASPTRFSWLSKVQLRTKPSPLERRLMRLLSGSPLGLHAATDELHKAMLRLATRENSPRGVMNISAVARTLGIQRHTLYRLLRRLA